MKFLRVKSLLNNEIGSDVSFILYLLRYEIDIVLSD